MKKRNLYAILTIGGAIGSLAAFLQMLEKLSLLADKDASLICNVNNVFSCTNVLNAPQSSVFGFPNALMCMALFIIFTVVGLVGLTGGTVSRGMRLGTQFLTLFTLGFALWFLWQSTYVIGSICIFCIFCFIGLLMANFAMLRINAADIYKDKSKSAKLQKLVAANIDLYSWAALGLLVTVLIFVRFYAS